MPGDLPQKRNRAACGLVIGTRELCGWQPVPGVVWIQSRDPDHARNLARRRDARQVAAGVAGGFLRIFEIPGTLTWARDLIARYTAGEACANELKVSPASPTVRDCNPGGVNMPAERSEAAWAKHGPRRAFRDAPDINFPNRRAAL